MAATVVTQLKYTQNGIENGTVKVTIPFLDVRAGAELLILPVLSGGKYYKLSSVDWFMTYAGVAYAGAVQFYIYQNQADYNSRYLFSDEGNGDYTSASSINGVYHQWTAIDNGGPQYITNGGLYWRGGGVSTLGTSDFVYYFDYEIITL